MSEWPSPSPAPPLTPPPLQIPSQPNSPYLTQFNEENTRKLPEFSPTKRRRDRIYYLEPIRFQVEDVLFNVPKYHFVASSNRFMRENDPDGLSADVPLVLSDISIFDFQSFLKILYPLDFEPSFVKSTAEWISILKLSTRWHFNKVRKIAIRYLTEKKMDPIDRVILARRFSVWNWLWSSYRDLVVRTEMISLEEAERIGWTTAHAICRMREEASRPYEDTRSDVINIDDTFAEERKAINTIEAAHGGLKDQTYYFGKSEKANRSTSPVPSSSPGKKKKKGKK